MVSPCPNPNEESSSGGDTVASQATDVGSGTISAVPITYGEPILTLRQPETPRPTIVGTSRKYMPSFIMPMYRTLGMPTKFMASMHNSSSRFGENPSSPFPPYQGLGPLVNQFGRPPGRCAKKHVDMGDGEEKQGLVIWLREKRYTRSARVNEIIDLTIAGGYDESEVKALAELALQCVEEDKDKRPTMSHVVEVLMK
ncbi:hypothetical protein KIW84_051416 [Lathyrus oleraceus]|uniref:Uncharacterized protein n=1 Tax=Pisum sativum TaxID=3888 RepID=A0A9D5AAM7_PEA|nr:hypothetical protein KIW84_051416 [Pisum sativum]